jgi:hypothetical protein
MNAHRNPSTSKPSIKKSAIKIIIAFINKRKSPKVTMVIGIVSNIKIGLTIAFNIAKTITNRNAEVGSVK